MLPKAILLKNFFIWIRSNLHLQEKQKQDKEIKGNNQTNPESGTSLKDNRLEFFKKSVRQAGGSKEVSRREARIGKRRGLDSVQDQNFKRYYKSNAMCHHWLHTGWTIQLKKLFLRLLWKLSLLTTKEGDMEGREGSSKGRGYMYTHSWFTLLL